MTEIDPLLLLFFFFIEMLKQNHKSNFGSLQTTGQFGTTGQLEPSKMGYFLFHWCVGFQNLTP